MQVILLSILIGLLGGVAIGFQTPLASLMGQRIGILEGAFIIHLWGYVGSRGHAPGRARRSAGRVEDGAVVRARGRRPRRRAD